MRYERVTFGIYGDSHGALHVDVPLLLARAAIVNTPFTRGWLARQAIRELRREGIDGVIVARVRGVKGMGH